MEIKNFKPLYEGVRKATFDIFFPNMGMTIKSFSLMEKDGKRWVSFPSKPFKTQEGETKYFSFVAISEEKYPAFQSKVKEMVAPLLLSESKPQNSDFGDLPF